MENIREKGIERIMKQLNISENLMDFAGRLDQLEKDPRIDLIEPIGGSLSKYSVYLTKNLGKEEIIDITKKYGFPEITNIGSEKDPFQLNFNRSFMLKFYQK